MFVKGIVRRVKGIVSGLSANWTSLNNSCAEILKWKCCNFETGDGNRPGMNPSLRQADRTTGR